MVINRTSCSNVLYLSCHVFDFFPKVQTSFTFNFALLFCCLKTTIKGQPKGLVHSTGGYALYAAFTTATTFNLNDGDIFACVADCGWITGHVRSNHVDVYALRVLS